MRQTAHRRDLGRYYKGLPMHAAPGVHEHAASICKRLLTERGRLLEVGSGSGALTVRLQDAGFEVVATDLEPSQPWMQQLDLELPDQCEEYRVGGFDLIVCIETMEHLENPRAALRSMRRILKPGSMVLISTPNISHPHSRLRFLRNSGLLTFSKDTYYSTGHITLLPEWLLREHLLHAGFSILLIEYAGSMQFGPLRRRIHQVEMASLGLLGITQRATADDGLCIFIVAQAV